MVKRCYVCRRPALTIEVSDHNVCQRCANAIDRVLELETTEMLLVNGLLNLRDSAVGEQATRTINSLLKRAQKSLVSLKDITRTLRRVLLVLDPTSGKGHALERIDYEGRLPKYGCIMPGCELCAVSGEVQGLLARLAGDEARGP